MNNRMEHGKRPTTQRSMRMYGGRLLMALGFTVVFPSCMEREGSSGTAQMVQEPAPKREAAQQPDVSAVGKAASGTSAPAPAGVASDQVSPVVQVGPADAAPYQAVDPALVHISARRWLDRADPLAVAQLASAESALARGEYVRFDPASAPPPFDQAAWQRDPDAYLTQVDARRIWQVAADGTAPELIAVHGAERVPVAAEGVVTLAWRTGPGAPVTVVSQGLGCFQNGLVTTTVAADAAGLAQVRFRATPGTVGDVVILAASPMRTGQVTSTVQVIETGTTQP